MAKKKRISETAQLLSMIKKKMRSAKIEKRKAQCECQHRGNNGKVYLRLKEITDKKTKDTKVVFRCKECHDIVDVEPVLNKSRKQVKKYIKETCKGFANVCNITKLSINPKYDKKYRKIISRAQFAAYQVQKLATIAIAEGFEPVRKKGKKGKKRGFNMSAGGAGFGR